MKEMKTLTFPSGETYEIVDEQSREDLNKKTEKVQIDYMGNKVFKLGEQTLNYQQLHDIHLVSPNFAFVQYGDRAYLLSYVQDDPAYMREMRFESVIATTDVNLSFVKTSGIYVRSSDGVNIAGVDLTDINSENKAYKATTIDANHKNDVWYPSVKAVADYVDPTKEDVEALKEDLDDLDSQLSELINELENVTKESVAFNFAMENGGLSTTNGGTNTSANRIRTKTFYAFKAGDELTCTNLLMIAFYYKNPTSTSFTFDHVDAAYDKKIRFKTDCYVRLVFKRENDAALNVTDNYPIVTRTTPKLSGYVDISKNQIAGISINTFTGAETASADYVATDFIRVTSGSKLIVSLCCGGSTNNKQGNGMAGYDANKNYVCPLVNPETITGLKNNTAGRIATFGEIVTIPGNVAYIRASSAISGDTYAQVNTPLVVYSNHPYEEETPDPGMIEKLSSLSRHNSLATGGSYTNPTPQKKDFVFGVMTDIHGSATQTKRFVDTLNRYDDYIDYGFCLGDIVAKAVTDDYAYCVNAVANSGVPIPFVIGNHDIGDVNKASISTADAFDRYIQHCVAKGWINTSKCYWSKDIDAYKIRVIALYQYEATKTSTASANHEYYMYYSSEQLQWFADTLADTPSGYSVIVLGHQIPSTSFELVENAFTADANFEYIRPILAGTPIEDILNAYITKSAISQTYSVGSYASDGLSNASVSKDFASALSSEFVCMVVGHSHFSAVARSTKYNNIKVVVCPSTSSNIYQRSFDDVTPLEVAIDDNFNLIGIDTQHKLVKLVKVGKTVTNTMRRRDFVSFPY